MKCFRGRISDITAARISNWNYSVMLIFLLADTPTLNPLRFTCLDVRGVIRTEGSSAFTPYLRLPEEASYVCKHCTYNRRTHTRPSAGACEQDLSVASCAVLTDSRAWRVSPCCRLLKTAIAPPLLLLCKYLQQHLKYQQGSVTARCRVTCNYGMGRSPREATLRSHVQTHPRSRTRPHHTRR